MTSVTDAAKTMSDEQLSAILLHFAIPFKYNMSKREKAEIMARRATEMYDILFDEIRRRAMASGAGNHNTNEEDK